MLGATVCVSGRVPTGPARLGSVALVHVSRTAPLTSAGAIKIGLGANAVLAPRDERHENDGRGGGEGLHPEEDKRIVKTSLCPHRTPISQPLHYPPDVNSSHLLRWLQNSPGFARVKIALRAEFRSGGRRGSVPIGGNTTASTPTRTCLSFSTGVRLRVLVCSRSPASQNETLEVTRSDRGRSKLTRSLPKDLETKAELIHPLQPPTNLHPSDRFRIRFSSRGGEAGKPEEACPSRLVHKRYVVAFLTDFVTPFVLACSPWASFRHPNSCRHFQSRRFSCSSRQRQASNQASEGSLLRKSAHKSGRERRNNEPADMRSERA